MVGLVLKRQNRVKDGTDKSKLEVKMKSVSDDDIRKRLLEKPRFELAHAREQHFSAWNHDMAAIWAPNQKYVKYRRV